MGKERVCERCHASISKEWDNEFHYGTCPSCKRGANFVILGDDLNGWQRDAKNKQEIKSLLFLYDVLDINKNSGVVHVKTINLAKLIMKECNMFFFTIAGEDKNKRQTYFYHDGYYHLGGENEIKRLVDYYLDEYSSIHRKNEVIDYIKNNTMKDTENLEPPINLINLKNGIYDIDTDSLLNHTPDFYFLNQLPIEYNKDADCPKIKAFFEQVVFHEYFDVMQELLGFILYREYFLHKAFLFLGGGRNGKGTTVNLIHKFIGKNNCSARSLTDLIENRFAKADLHGKLANLGAEVSGKTIMETSDFKNLTGGEPITGEKKFLSAFSFYNYAKLIFNANTLPKAGKDDTIAYFDRWIIVVFPQTFEMGDPRTDPKILNKLTTKGELSGLFNWAVLGLKRVLKSRRFSYFENENEDETGERYMTLIKHDRQFIKDHLDYFDDGIIPVAEVYDVYKEWATKRRYPVLTKNSFSRSMKRWMVKKTDNDKYLRCDIVSTHLVGKPVKCYKNVRWKEEIMDATNRVGSLESFDEKSLSDKLKELKRVVKDNEFAGFKISIDFLYNNFDKGFINQAIQSGLLEKKPDGSYYFKE